jgi:hypothetical protein
VKIDERRRTLQYVDAEAIERNEAYEAFSAACRGQSMKNGYRAMDSDMHVVEPCDLWQKYIDQKFADRAPIGLNRHKRDLGVQVEGKIMPRAPEKPNPALRPVREKILNQRYP